MSIQRVKLRTAIAEYLTEDATYAAYALSTQRGYRRSLDILHRVVPSQAMAYELKAAWIDLAMKDLREGASDEENATRARLGLSPRKNRGAASLGNDVKAFKAFVKFLWRREYLGYAKNPVAHLKANPASGDGADMPIETMVVQPDENVWERILEAAGKRHPRDRMTCALGAYAGLRESELTSLKISGLDVDKTVVKDGVEVHAPEIRVWRQKNKKWHRVPMAPPLEAEARRYLAWYESVHGPLNPDWLVLATRRSGLEKLTRDGRFLPDTGRLHATTPLDPMNRPRTLGPDIKAAFKNAGFEPLYRTGAHTLRRMAAIYINGVTGQKDAAQYLLGHEARRTTERYLQWSDRDAYLREAMSKLPNRSAVSKTAKIHSDVSSNVIQFPSRQNVA